MGQGHLPQGLKAYICHGERRRRGGGGFGLGLQSGGSQFTGQWKSKSLVNKCLPESSLTIGHRGDFERKGLARFLPVYPTLTIKTLVIYDDSSFPGSSLLNSFRQ